MTILAARGIRKSYGGREVVAGIDLELSRGECYGLLGPNGAGKTTTLRMLLGLTVPDAGEITLLDHPVPKAAREGRIRVGVVPQIDNLDPDFTVRENLVVYGRYFGIDEKAMEERLPRLLEFAALEARAGSRIQELSGGMKRRLVLARALVNDPELLFLDEPTTGLDPQSRRALWDTIATLRSRGKTVVLTTHYMDEAERLCDRVAIVDHGKRIALGTPNELIDRLGGHHLVELATDPALPAEALASVRGVRTVRPHGDGVVLSIDEPHVALPALVARLAERGVRPTRLVSRTATLDDVFLSLTGRTLRED
jgi:lipooligosaccharide transport system ATP-binding protein